MHKITAIQILGDGNQRAAARLLDISLNSPNQWPAILPAKLTREVIGAAVIHRKQLKLTWKQIENLAAGQIPAQRKKVV